MKKSFRLTRLACLLSGLALLSGCATISKGDGLASQAGRYSAPDWLLGVWSDDNITLRVFKDHIIYVNQAQSFVENSFRMHTVVCHWSSDDTTCIFLFDGYLRYIILCKDANTVTFIRQEIYTGTDIQVTLRRK